MKTRRTLKIALIVGMLAAFAGRGAVASDKPGGCGGSLAAGRVISCPFIFRGFPLIVRGTASAAGTASVHVWMSVVQGGPAIWECSASGNRSAGCNANVPDGSTPIQNGLLHQTLYCNAEGATTGTWYCQSALGL